jgi:hypothetical protein
MIDEEVAEYLRTGHYRREDGSWAWPAEVLMHYDSWPGELWQAAGGPILREFVRQNPGRRPWAWWEYDAPRAREMFKCDRWAIPRRRLGGIGREVWLPPVLSAYVPDYSFGLPTWFAKHSVTDPPRFESQAAYLTRYGLLAPGEAALITPQRLAAEFVAPRSWDRLTGA